MPFCSNCGAPVEGRFCAKCGTPAGQDASGGPTTAPAKPDLPANVAAALCYVPGLVPAIVFLVWSPYNRDKSISFHAYQSIFLQISWIVALVALDAVLSAISEAAWYAMARLINLAGVLLSAFMIWKTYQKESIVLPFIGPLARKQV